MVLYFLLWVYIRRNHSVDDALKSVLLFGSDILIPGRVVNLGATLSGMAVGGGGSLMIRSVAATPTEIVVGCVWSVVCNPEFRVIWSFHYKTPGYFGLECGLALQKFWSAKYPAYGREPEVGVLRDLLDRGQLEAARHAEPEELSGEFNRLCPNICQNSVNNYCQSFVQGC